jgi:hypothetical protein
MPDWTAMARKAAPTSEPMRQSPAQTEEPSRVVQRPQPTLRSPRDSLGPYRHQIQNSRT